MDWISLYRYFKGDFCVQNMSVRLAYIWFSFRKWKWKMFFNVITGPFHCNELTILFPLFDYEADWWIISRSEKLFWVCIAHHSYKVYSLVYGLCLICIDMYVDIQITCVTQSASHEEYNLFSLHTYVLGKKHFFSGTWKEREVAHRYGM